jgi:hypothetical protein
VCEYVAEEDVGSFTGVYVTSGSCVSGMACVGGCPTLIAEGEVHQHINPNVKYIATLGLTLLHEARMKA